MIKNLTIMKKSALLLFFFAILWMVFAQNDLHGVKVALTLFLLLQVLGLYLLNGFLWAAIVEDELREKVALVICILVLLFNLYAFGSFFVATA